MEPTSQILLVGIGRGASDDSAPADWAVARLILTRVISDANDPKPTMRLAHPLRSPALLSTASTGSSDRGVLRESCVSDRIVGGRQVGREMPDCLGDQLADAIGVRRKAD